MRVSLSERLAVNVIMTHSSNKLIIYQLDSIIDSSSPQSSMLDRTHFSTNAVGNNVDGHIFRVPHLRMKKQNPYRITCLSVYLSQQICSKSTGPIKLKFGTHMNFCDPNTDVQHKLINYEYFLFAEALYEFLRVLHVVWFHTSIDVTRYL